MLIKIDKNNKNIFFLISIFIIFFLILINAKPNFPDDYISKGFPDTVNYMKIADSISKNSVNELNYLIPAHHLERWPIHYLNGIINKHTNIPKLQIYRLITFICLLMCILIISEISGTLLDKVILFSIISLNPYVFMEILFAPPMIGDGIFLFSTLALVVGIKEKKHKYVYIGILLGILTRQTSLVYLPILTVATFLGFIRVKDLYKFLLFFIGFYIVFKLINYTIFKVLPEQHLIVHILGFYHWFKNPEFITLKPFLESTFAFLLTLSPLLILNVNKKYICLSIVGIVGLICQPILGGPLVTGSNAARLIAFSLPFIAMAFLMTNKNSYLVILFLILMMINSAHHNYSLILGGYSKIHYTFLLLTTFLIAVATKVLIILNNKYQFIKIKI